MIFGTPITPIMIVAGGATVFTLLVFQVLLGLRIIKLGKHHYKIHRWVAYTILGVAVIHASAAITMLFGLSIG